MTADLTTREAFEAAILTAPVGSDLWRVFADWCEERGDDATAEALRTGRYQVTREGERIVTVGRDGPDHDRHGNGIYTTKIYRAERRKDGVLTWRLAASVPGHRTAGKRVTAPMTERAEAYAEERGLGTCDHVTHGTRCV